jgi:hypothetical protein
LLNRYSYANNNPINYEDSTGHLSAYHHFVITYSVAREVGLSPLQAIVLGLKVVMVDLFHWGDPNKHAQPKTLPGGRPQTPAEVSKDVAKAI